MKNMVFDFGQVLVAWDPRRLYRRIFAAPEEMEWFLTHVCTAQWNACQDAGRPFEEGIALLQKQYPAYAAQIADYYKRWPEMLGGEIAGMPALLKELKDKGYKLYGLSNWSAQTFPLARARYGVFDLLDGMVLSGREKVIKPQKEIYRILLARYGLQAPDCVFIDDSPANVAAAAEMGFEAIRFENAAVLRRQLQARGLL